MGREADRINRKIREFCRSILNLGDSSKPGDTIHGIFSSWDFSGRVCITRIQSTNRVVNVW